MKQIINLLHSGNYSCVIENDGQIHTFTQKGIADLYRLVTDKSGFLENAFVADKVVGKAAAALLILGKIRKIYAETVSLPALRLLTDADIETEFDNTVSVILNSNRTDYCPLEKLCGNEDSATKILPLIEGFINKQHKITDKNYK